MLVRREGGCAAAQRAAQHGARTHSLKAAHAHTRRKQRASTLAESSARTHSPKAARAHTCRKQPPWTALRLLSPCACGCADRAAGLAGGVSQLLVRNRMRELRADPQKLEVLSAAESNPPPESST
eukprot:6068020-Prymnesium_polylepis.1